MRYSSENPNKSITKHLIDEIFFNRSSGNSSNSNSKYKHDRNRNHTSRTNRSSMNSCNPTGMTTPIEGMLLPTTGKNNQKDSISNKGSLWRVNL